ncbi:hypothetical protein SAMN05660826_01333 [Caldanaerovirga acetigignens]|uniref:Uncharacterized protein n=2 Tax=Caldanaerovirga acetigignens TaxID=447595 RepID=A0A1M7JT85_9FIRM|nr:hypothetical protein SAMN05660826_01333 [Caldanaerovirga acetigignens]
MAPEMNSIVSSTILSLKSLSVYRRLLEDPLIKKFENLLKAAKSGDPLLSAEAYCDLLYGLLAKSERALGVGNSFQNLILDLMLEDENPFSLSSERAGKDTADHLKKLVKTDLKLLKSVFEFNFEVILSFIKAKLGLDLPSIPINREPKGNKFPYPEYYYREKYNLKQKLETSTGWENFVDDLAEFYKKVGCGIFGKYWAFRVKEKDGKLDLIGIAEPDPIRIHDIIGYEEQKMEVLRNTEQFVKGFKANNVLLYGDRGTGKSSTVKAMLHEFGERGLRIVEVLKYQLTCLPQIISLLRTRPQRFIVFIDDLSFEEHETEYKYLKAILEGSLEKTPENLLIYATSNRRHIVKEFTKDRTDELKPKDTVQEKLSLSDRFGITVVFPSPDQEAYLEIVEGIAKKRGINLDGETLRKLALRWELWNNQRSGRTARQFIDDLEGRLASGKLLNQQDY